VEFDDDLLELNKITNHEGLLPDWLQVLVEGFKAKKVAGL
jgi:hypothetical protein